MSELSIKGTYNGIAWTGGSSIHVSYAKSVLTPVERHKWPVLIHLLTKVKVMRKTFTALTKMFRHTEWFIDDAAFESLALASHIRHSRGLAPITAESMIQNPATGNLFYRVGMKNGYVVAVRFWCLPEGIGDYISEPLGPYESDYRKLGIGFRVRIEKMKESEEVLRIRADTEVREASEVISEATSEFIEISEPVGFASENEVLAKAEVLSVQVLMEIEQ